MAVRPLYIDPTAPDLVERQGEKPLTTRPSAGLPHPHQQLDQLAAAGLAEELAGRAGLLPGVEVTSSCVSVPGARAFHLSEDRAGGPPAAFQCGREFAHVHPVDGSLHLTLPARVKAEVGEKGWGEPHPLSGTMLVFGPRDRAELELVWQLVVTSYRYAIGDVERSADVPAAVDVAAEAPPFEEYAGQAALLAGRSARVSP